MHINTVIERQCVLRYSLLCSGLGSAYLGSYTVLPRAQWVSSEIISREHRICPNLVTYKENDQRQDLNRKGEADVCPAESLVSNWIEAFKTIKLQDFRLDNFLSIPCMKSSLITGAAVGSAVFTASYIVSG